MNELDFSFGDSPWEQLLSSRQPGESVSAAHLLALLEEEEEQAVEDAFQDLESMEIGLDVSDLPRVKAAGEATARLLREMELSKDGITPDQWEPDDPLRMYLEELAATPVYGEEGLLAVQAAQGDEQAKQNLACMGLSRVLEIAREFTGFGVLLLDLIQEGSLGLWQAVNRCDDSNYKNIRDFWIRFYMAKAVTLQARANGVGQKARRGLEDYKQVDERLLGELGRNPTLEETGYALRPGPEGGGASDPSLRSGRKAPGDAGGSWKTAWDFAPGGFADRNRCIGKASQRSEKRNSFPIEQQKAGLPYGK